MKRVCLLAICLCLALAAAPTAQAEQTEETVPANGITLLLVQNGPDFIDSEFSTANINVWLRYNSQPYDKKAIVTWTVISVDNSSNAAMPATHHRLAMGLNWGDTPPRAFREPLTGSVTTQNESLTGVSKVQLTDIVGERTVVVRASADIEGNSYTAEFAVSFGKGPLSQFRVVPFEHYLWADYQPVSNAANGEAGSFPAAMACGSKLTPAELRNLPDGYHAATNLPSKDQLRKVMGQFGNNAWFAAGWPDSLWSGELYGGGSQSLSVGIMGTSFYVPVNQRAFPVVCLRVVSE